MFIEILILNNVRLPWLLLDYKFKGSQDWRAFFYKKILI